MIEKTIIKEIGVKQGDSLKCTPTSMRYFTLWDCNLVGKSEPKRRRPSHIYHSDPSIYDYKVENGNTFKKKNQTIITFNADHKCILSKGVLVFGENERARLHSVKCIAI